MLHGLGYFPGVGLLVFEDGKLHDFCDPQKNVYKQKGGRFK